MKVLLINGSPNEKGCTFTALSEVCKGLIAAGLETEIVHVGDKQIAGCKACYRCLPPEGNLCIIDDDIVNEVVRKALAADAIILGTPVYYGGIAGNFKTFLDRFFQGGRKSFATKLGAAVVSCRRAGASGTFDQLNHFFTLSSMPVVASQYWNLVHGAKPEDLLKDEEGMQTMRTLAKNMAWLLASIEAGRNAGIEKPAYEPLKRTNFIR